MRCYGATDERGMLGTGHQPMERPSSYRLRALYCAWYEELEGSPVRCVAVAADAAIGVRSGALPGAPPPRAGAKSMIFNHSSSLINPLRASYSSPVHASGKSSRPRRFHCFVDRDITMRNELGHQNALRVSGLLLVLTAHPRRRLRQSILAREFSSTMLNECPSLRASARSPPTRIPPSPDLIRVLRFCSHFPKLSLLSNNSLPAPRVGRG